MASLRARSHIGFLVVIGALLACGGKEAVEDLEKLKTKTCSCKGDSACVEEAKKMAREWVTKHKNARGADQQKVEQIMKELTECDLTVVLEIGKGVQ
jgi:hypothetical protein